MTNQPLVSIITPFFNAENYIEETIRSVLAQTYQHWELLLIDDGSSDASSSIARRYAEQHPEKIRYHEHEGHQNRGKSVSRNLGIHQAAGAYVALLDADDVYLPPKLERQVALLETERSAGFVYGPTLYWFSWLGSAQHTMADYEARLGAQLGLVRPPILVTQYLRDGATVPCTCGLLARREVIESVGGFDERIQHLYEDQVFLFKLCLAAPVYIDAGCWDKYRQHPESSWHRSLQSGQEYEARLTFLRWLEDYLGEQGVQDPQLWRALRTQYWPYEYPRLFRLAHRSREMLRQMKRMSLKAA